MRMSRTYNVYELRQFEIDRHSQVVTVVLNWTHQYVVLILSQ